ncbi:50S ribosomal protein L22 [Candidatus Uhrbacteria bacterium]|jgi:large subunit ribosomal protein L22|nr:50S ribosomal protein L22 [Candidatus Uhrbacteria bacterium]
MSESKAKLRFLRMSPRKVRLLADMVRGMDVANAIIQLTFSSKDAARPVRKLIESAAANAVNNHGMEKEKLVVSTITVDGGPTIKRSTPRAHGRATPIRKRTSHVNVILTEKGGSEENQVAEKVAKADEVSKPAAKKAAVKKPVAKAAAKPAAKKTESKKPAAKKAAADNKKS